MIKYVGMKKIFVYFLLTCLSMTLAHAQGMPLGKDSLSDNKISVTVKTNAMALGMLIANAGVELGFGDRFSLHIPFYYSGTNYFSSHTKFRILGTQPEFRYWTPLLKGCFGGVHLGVASWNFAYNRRWRYQDKDGSTPALGGGVSVGYRMPIGAARRWGMEFSLGAGCYRLHYDKFRNESNGALVESRQKTFFGIDQVNISITYTFGRGGE